MGQQPKTRWVVRGAGQWSMVVMAWIIALLAGDQLMDAIRGEGDWLSGIGMLPLSAVTWLAALRTKRATD